MFCNIYTWGGRRRRRRRRRRWRWRWRRRSAVAAKAGVGGRPQAKSLEGAPRRWGVWESTSPRSPWLGVWGRRYGGCGTRARLRLSQGQGPAPVDTPRGSMRNRAGKNFCASSLGADCTDTLQCNCHERCFEWTNVVSVQLRPRAPLSSVRLRVLLSPLPLFVFFRGGLGVGEKPTCGELVQSTHRVPSHFISSQRFLFETFR